MNKTQEILEVLKANPDRELIFMYPEDGSDHSYTLGHPSRILIDEYVTIDDRVWLRLEEEDELHETITENIGDDMYSKFPLTDEQIEDLEKRANRKIKDLNWKKAIVVYISY